MAKKSRLDSISVPKPCAEDWNKMDGGEKSRFCGICEKNVYNISAMTAREADKLLFENTEKVCIRMEKDADGKIKTLKNQLHQITRQAPIAAGVLSATLAFSAVTLAQGEPIRINSDKVNIVQTMKDDAAKTAISGTIYDEAGAVIPNVKVVLRNVKNNSIQKTVSNGDGIYLFSYIEPSVYEIETDDVVGFRKFTAKNIEVSGKNNLQLNMILQVNLSELMGDVVFVSTESVRKTTDEVSQTEKNTISKSSISGIVKDLSDGTVPNVKITLSDVKNNLSQSTTSNLDGKYYFNDLKPSVYRMDFEANGFKKSIFENIKIENKDLLLNVILEIGAPTIYLQPDAEIKPESPKTADKIAFASVKELPPSKNTFLLGLTASGINKSSNQTRRISFTVVDSAEALINGAKIVLTNEKNKKKFTASSNESGNVEFGDLPIGNYKLRISANGFETKRITLNVDEKAVSNQKIVLESKSISVTVGMADFK